MVRESLFIIFATKAASHCESGATFFPPSAVDAKQQKEGKNNLLCLRRRLLVRLSAHVVAARARALFFVFIARVQLLRQSGEGRG